MSDDMMVPVRAAITGLPGVEVTNVRAVLGGGIIHLRFPNGYGASIIRHFASYGNAEGLFEVGVLGQDGSLDYTTPITEDVIGYLTPEEVRVLLLRIIALPKPE